MCGPNIHIEGIAEPQYETVANSALLQRRLKVRLLFDTKVNSHHELRRSYRPRGEAWFHQSLGINPATGEMVCRNACFFLEHRGHIPEDIDRDRHQWHDLMRQEYSTWQSRARTVWDTHYPTLEKLGEWSMFAESEIGNSRGHAEVEAMEEWEKGFSLLVHPRHKDAAINYACLVGKKAEDLGAAANVLLTCWRRAFWQRIIDNPNEYWRDRIAHPPVAAN